MTSARARAQDILATLVDEANPAVELLTRERVGIPAEKMYGVSMRRLNEIAKRTPTDHELALELWDEGSYEARTIATMVDDPQQVTSEQMQRWCDDFDGWMIVDKACFELFGRTPHAWSMADCWVEREPLFVRRAGFALLWALAHHDKESDDELFRQSLVHVRAKANDPRPLVGDSITRFLFAIAGRRPALLDEVLAVANELTCSADAATRRVGRPIERFL